MLNSEMDTPTAAYRSHIGISNVRKRLRLLYGFNASLEIHSQMNFGTEIIITIPIDKEPAHEPGFLKETK
ncbi:hypothetical protein [Marispirochaeta sp.]|uniref:sensor histidine kinase n=1 Tax=Marispirochaeta sp. TaxID=2038653 RepID=UPI0029C6375D|nr:hypothetical protein [Marispirochaeta sp.]